MGWGGQLGFFVQTVMSSQLLFVNAEKELTSYLTQILAAEQV
jgi:hypothetical protein